MSRMDARLADAMTAGCLSPTARHVLLVLTIMANASGFTDLPVDRLAELTGASRRTVQGSLRRLARERHITRYASPGGPSITHLHPRGLDA